jgi:hypothetical protein
MIGLKRNSHQNQNFPITPPNSFSFSKFTFRFKTLLDGCLNLLSGLVSSSKCVRVKFYGSVIQKIEVLLTMIDLPQDSPPAPVQGSFLF